MGKEAGSTLAFYTRIVPHIARLPAAAQDDRPMRKNGFSNGPSAVRRQHIWERLHPKDSEGPSALRCTAAGGHRGALGFNIARAG
jgi:hypothetical protein